jgi:hypothetical protein
MAIIFSTPSQMHCRLAGARGEGEMAGRRDVAVPVAAGGDKRAGRAGVDSALALSAAQKREMTMNRQRRSTKLALDLGENLLLKLEGSGFSGNIFLDLLAKRN